MDIIKTGRGLTRTIRNVARAREIMTVLARNGFSELLDKSGVSKWVPNFALPKADETTIAPYQTMGGILGFQLRKSFEELGPGFIKIGQLLSGREDLFPPDFIFEMRKLQSQVKGIPFSAVEKVLNKSLGKPWQEIFESIESKPVGTASIGVVHKAVLKNGETVVLKVRRPKISQIIETDIEIFQLLVQSLDRVSEEIRTLGLRFALKDFQVTLRNELDFNIEYMNAQKIFKVIKQYDSKNNIYLPKFYEEYVSRDILVMEYIEGIPFNQPEKLEPHKKDLQKKLEYSISIFVKNILKDGFFHADLHGGNFFYLPETKQIAVIDYGLAGHLSKKNRINLVAILYSIFQHNYENVTYEFLEVAEFQTIPDIDTLVKDLKDNVSPFVGLSVQKIDIHDLFRSIVGTLMAHKLYLPRDWYIVFRALTSMDGVGKSLKIDFDIFGIIEEDLNEIVEAFSSKDQLLEEGVWLSRELLSTLRVVPRHLKWFLKDISKKGYQLEIKTVGYEKQIESLASSIVFVGHVILTSILFYCGMSFVSQEIAEMSDLPKVTLILWTLSTLSLFRGLQILSRK